MNVIQCKYFDHRQQSALGDADKLEKAKGGPVRGINPSQVIISEPSEKFPGNTSVYLVKFGWRVLLLPFDEYRKQANSITKGK